MNMSIAGSTTNPNAERVQPITAPAKPLADTRTPNQSLPHNAKDLKIAEITGQKINIGEEQIVMAIEKANKALQGSYTSFEFSIHEGTKEIMVKVLDRDTGELIREIPSEKILDMVAKLWEMSGVLVDERG
jgi:flagellar protein FlaG